MQSVLAGRYRLERQLGKGGMGSVWLAEHLALRSWVAVKLMDPAIAATPEGAERFRREAQAAASLRSAHVVQVLDYGLHETTPFLVMELLQGESLAGCLEREKRLTPERTLAIITQVARALGRAHAAGIVHRDLKPDNVFLVREDDQELVKVLDFGIAKTPQSQFGGMETRTGVTMGTPYYMSPEQVEGKRAVDFRTDLWAMAVITCECMTGIRPFDGSTFGELLLNICARPIAPPSSQGLQLRGFDEWFARATRRDSEQRFASAQDLVNALRDVVTGAAGAHGFSPPVAGSAHMPAPVTASGHGPQGSAATGGGFAAGEHPGSAPSINTAQALELATRSSGRSALPWVLLGVVITLGAIGGAVLLLRPSTDAAAEAASSSSSAAAAPANSPNVALAPPPESSPQGETAAKSKPVEAGKAGAAPAKTEPVGPKPPTATAATGPAAPAPAATPAGKTARCFNDPFSGQVRLAGSGPAPDAPTFACKQDPFTGKWKKL
ncbi:MAG TPA: serine/threonine-protein kinase [Polyangiaceae bacterium]|nr:serine/threonine-protein kinase [Polyangiaceae bacterium]